MSDYQAAWIAEEGGEDDGEDDEDDEEEDDDGDDEMVGAPVGDGEDGSESEGEGMESLARGQNTNRKMEILRR